MPDYETFKLGNWKLQSGEELPDAHLAFKTFGERGLPAIVYPTWYSGLITDNEWLIGEDKTLNPNKYFIIIPALFGNSQSTSPSNSPNIKPFPKVTVYDNVRAQHELVTKHFDITHLHAVVGWSMGAGQTFQWITQYPDMVDLAVPFCGAAKTSLHNQVFLEGQKSYLFATQGKTSAGSGEGHVGDDQVRSWSEEEKTIAMKAFARGYAGWGFSQAFYRERLFEKHFGFKDLESFMQGFWETWALSKDPENMLTMLLTWQSGDCSNQEPYNGDFEKAMKSIKAKTLVLPAKTDMYFPPEDSEIEVANMSPGVGELGVFPTIWGHWAGGPGDSEEDFKWLDTKMRDWFEKHSKTRGAVPIMEPSK